MNKMRWAGLSALGFFLAAFFLGAMVVRAENLDERIEALEKEVARVRPLEDELARLKAEQMALKREATAAAAALPTFTYRPRSGLFIDAADKSWGLQFRGRFHYGSSPIPTTRPKTRAASRNLTSPSGASGRGSTTS